MKTTVPVLEKENLIRKNGKRISEKFFTYQDKNVLLQVVTFKHQELLSKRAVKSADSSAMKTFLNKKDLKFVPKIGS